MNSKEAIERVSMHVPTTCGGPTPCYSCAENVRALTVLEADARALRAVRVLDAKLARFPECTSWEVGAIGGEFFVTFTDAQRDSLDGPWDDASGRGPDAARIAAAEALVKEDPSLGDGL
jgi:hypothetical protein